MRQLEMCAIALAVTLLVSGCVSVERAGGVAPAGVSILGAPGTPDEHVLVSNYGYYLFNCIPLFCGNTAREQRGETVWFANEVTLEKTQEILMDEVRSRKCRVAEIQPHVKSTCFFGVIPYVGTTFGLVWYKEVQMSAVLVRSQQAAVPRGGAR